MEYGSQVNFKGLFGPYEEFPHAALLSDETSRLCLFREIYEWPVEQKREGMTLKQWILHFLFLYEPESDCSDKSPKVSVEKLAEDIDNFSIFEKDKKYYIGYR